MRATWNAAKSLATLLGNPPWLVGVGAGRDDLIVYLAEGIPRLTNVRVVPATHLGWRVRVESMEWMVPRGPV